MDDIDFFDAMMRGTWLSDDDLKELNKTRLERICGWLTSCGQAGCAMTLRMLFLGAAHDISKGYRRPII